MTEQWPEDGTQPWAEVTAGKVRLEWGDHIFVLTPEQAGKLAEALRRLVRRMNEEEQR